MGFDSKEDKENQESISRKIEAVKALLSDKEAMAKLKESFESLIPSIEAMIERERYELLNEDELKIKEEIHITVGMIQESFSEMKLLLDLEQFEKSTRFFFHLKKLAEEGNEDAKKVYNDLL